MGKELLDFQSEGGGTPPIPAPPPPPKGSSVQEPKSLQTTAPLPRVPAAQQAVVF